MTISHPLKEIYFDSLYIVFILALIFGVTLFLTTRNMIRPLMNITDLFQKLHQNGHQAFFRFPIFGTDEMGRLSDWFNHFIHTRMRVQDTVEITTSESTDLANDLSESQREIASSLQHLTTLAARPPSRHRAFRVSHRTPLAKRSYPLSSENQTGKFARSSSPRAVASTRRLVSGASA